MRCFDIEVQNGIKKNYISPFSQGFCLNLVSTLLEEHIWERKKYFEDYKRYICTFSLEASESTGLLGPLASI